jgi:hypothetical protein
MRRSRNIGGRLGSVDHATVDDVVSTWKTPAKYTRYTAPDPADAAQVRAAEARVRADAQVIWDETK